ncbi:MAG: LysR family transcriptional regulator [Clostridia bacterium]|nr:LysR family transcriptional regulator [Clostridia bacterium]
MSADLELYRIFDKVVREGSFSKAAAGLYISQPAVSQAMANLENQLNTTLFVREARGVKTTPEGQMLFEYINTGLSLIKSGEEKLEELKALSEGELKIGAGDTISRHFLLPVIEKFHSIYPKIKIKVINRTSPETISLLKSGKIDIGFVNTPVSENNIKVINCFDVHDIFVAPNKFWFLKDKKISKKELCKYPIIMLEKKANSRKYVDGIFRDEGVILEPEIELGAHDLLIEFCKIGYGISCVTREFSKEAVESGEVFEINLSNPIPKREIALCHIEGVSLSFAAKSFMNFALSKI